MPLTQMKRDTPSALQPDNLARDEGLESQDLSLGQAIRVLRKRYRVIVIALTITLLLAVVASLVLPPRYDATSTIELKQNPSNPLGGELGEVASSLTGQSDLKTDMQTAISTFQNDALGIEVLERLHARNQWRGQGFLRNAKANDEDKNGVKDLSLRETPELRERLLAKFENSLKAQGIPNTRLLQITYQDRDKIFAASVANAVVDQYIKDALKRRNSVTTDATEWMASQLNDLRKQVEVAQQRLVDFEKKSGFIVVPSLATSGIRPGGETASGSPQLHSTLLDRLTTLNQTLVQAQAARISQEAIVRIVQSQDPNAIAALATTASLGATVPTGSAQANAIAGLLSLRQQQIALKQQLASSFDTFGAKNPRVIDMNRQVAFLDLQMKEETSRIVATSLANLKMAQDTESGVRREVMSLEGQANEINDSAVRLVVLQQEADSTRALYETLYTKLEEGRLAEQTQASNVVVISDALPAAQASFPNWFRNLAAALVCGVIFGVILAFIRETLDDTIEGSVQVEAITLVPVLGSIPQFDLTKRRENTDGKLEAGNLPAFPFAKLMGAQSQAGEAYRSLRTSIMLSQAGSPPRTLLVTSALPLEGKSTTCYNLAVSFAMLGKKVLLVDADMRKPVLHRRTGQASAHGLSWLLTSATNPGESIIRDPNVQNLSLLTAGAIPPNPAELLGSPIFASLVASTSTQFDLVIIDSPPVLLVADSAIMAANVDGVVVVVRAGSSTRVTLSRTIRTLRRARANLFGVILNMVDTKSSEYYYEHGYYGKNYYGEKLDEHLEA